MKRKTFEQKIDDAKRSDIYLPSDLLDDKNIVGVYGFFAIKEGKEDYCFYIGKATNPANRLLGSDSGHVYQYLHDNFSKLVPQKMNDYLKDHYKIEVRILKKN